MAVESPPWATQAGSFGAEQTRRAVFAWAARTGTNSPGIITGGLGSATDCQVTAPASGLSVNVGTGEMVIGGNEGGSQGGYGPCRITSTTNIPLAAANPSNPRVDLICGTVNDAQYTAPSGGVASGQWSPVAITGTPTAGASVTPGSGGYLAGAPAVPGSSLALAWVLTPAGATNTVTADILNVATPFTFQGIGGPTVRGATNISTSQSTSSTTYTTLSTPDQVTGIVLPTNGLIAIWYQAQWQMSVAGAGRAAIFLGSNQLQVQGYDGSTGHQPLPQAAFGNAASVNQPLFTFPGGLGSGVSTSAFSADVTTGQLVGFFNASGGQIGATVGAGSASNFFNYQGSTSGVAAMGGPCYVFAAAGTYTVSVQFKASSGSVTAANRNLWVEALPFS